MKPIRGYRDAPESPFPYLRHLRIPLSYTLSLRLCRAVFFASLRA